MVVCILLSLGTRVALANLGAQLGHRNRQHRLENKKYGMPRSEGQDGRAIPAMP
jgi:hypothetical protein